MVELHETVRAAFMKEATERWWGTGSQSGIFEGMASYGGVVLNEVVGGDRGCGECAVEEDPTMLQQFWRGCSPKVVGAARFNF